MTAQDTLKFIEEAHTLPYAWQTEATFSEVEDGYPTTRIERHNLTATNNEEAIREAWKLWNSMSKSDREKNKTFSLFYAPRHEEYAKLVEKWDSNIDWRFAGNEIDLRFTMENIERANETPWHCFENIVALGDGYYYADVAFTDIDKPTKFHRDFYLLKVEGDVKKPKSFTTLADFRDGYASLVFSGIECPHDVWRKACETFMSVNNI